MRTGYVDTGMSPNQTQPVETAAAKEADAKKLGKKKQRSWASSDPGCVTARALYSDSHIPTTMKDFYICDCVAPRKQSHHLELSSSSASRSSPRKLASLTWLSRSATAAASSKPKCGTTSRKSSTPSSRTTSSRSKA